MKTHKRRGQTAARSLPFVKGRWARLAIKLLGVTGAIVIIFSLLYAFAFKPTEAPAYGVSFSEKRSTEFGLDWRENYIALLDDLKLRTFRLMSYWDLHEPSRGQFDFSALDWQMDEAAKRGAKVNLAIGLRQPRWPECHQPEWALQLSGNSWKQALYSYIEVVVNRYKNHPALSTWQLENEGMNNWFGKCGAADRQRLIEEFDLVRKLDSSHKINMSLSDQHGLPFGEPTPDAYGFSVYRLVWNDKVPPAGYIVYPTPIWYHRMREALILLIKQREVFIHELQMEPWGKTDTANLSIAEQDKSMSVEQIGKMFDFAKKTGIKEIDVWGGEWWYWRKVNGDPTVWEKIRSELNKR